MEHYQTMHGRSISESFCSRTGQVEFLRRQRLWSEKLSRYRALKRSSVVGDRRLTAPTGSVRRDHRFLHTFLVLLVLFGVPALVFGTNCFPKCRTKGLLLIDALRAVEARVHAVDAATCLPEPCLPRVPMLLGEELPEEQCTNVDLSVTLQEGGCAEIEPDVCPDVQKKITDYLDRLGVERGKLVSWGSCYWRYSCIIAGHQFETVAATETAAMKQTAEKITTWLAQRQSLEL